MQILTTILETLLYSIILVIAGTGAFLLGKQIGEATSSTHSNPKRNAAPHRSVPPPREEKGGV